MISLNRTCRKRMFGLLKTPRAIKLREFQKILKEYDFHLTHVRGSHHKFKNQNGKSITVPVHNKKVEKVYVKKIIKLLLFYL